MPLPDPSAESSLLHGELRWLIRLRWLAAAAVIVGSLVNGALAGEFAGAARFLALGAGLLGYNTVLHLVLARLGRAPRAAPLRAHALGQIGVDLLCLTLACLWTGGMASPLLGLFVLHMVFASVLLPAAVSFGAAGVAIAMLFGGLAVTGTWPDDDASLRAGLVWILLLLLTTYVANHLMANLRARDRSLIQQTRRMNAIMETAADGIVTIDTAGTILSMNPVTEELFGYDRTEMIGRNVTILMPSPHRDQHDGYLEAYLETGLARIIGIGREAEGRRKDGTTFPVDLAVSEVRIGDERFFTGILRDISERKQSEQKLRDLNNALQRQQQALVQHEKMAAMGQMAAGVAHEIANPLASMDSLLQLAQRRPERLDGKAAETLRNQVQRIDAIVRQLTEFAHPGSTGWENAELNPLIDSALELLRFDKRLREIEVVRSFDAEVGKARIIPQAFQQVVVNLVSNAIDAVANTPKPRIELETRVEDGEYVISVSDNGPGVPPDHRHRIFEPFFTTKPVGRGTGLGLSISYSIVEHLGGSCQFEDNGPGACFTVRLPASRSREGGPEGHS
jgi:two-component system sensor kinase FixL